MKNILSLFWLLFLTKSQIFSQIIADFETPATTPKFGYGKDAKVIDNPNKVGNPSSKVAYYKKEVTNWKFIALDFPSKIAIKSNDILSFKVQIITPVNWGVLGRDNGILITVINSITQRNFCIFSSNKLYISAF